MHDPVDQPSDRTSSLAAGADGRPERALAVTIAPDIPPDEPVTIAQDGGAETSPGDPEIAAPDGRAPRLVTPTMWR